MTTFPQQSDIRISIVMPVFNTPPDILEEAIRSVQDQTYANWELCVCDDCSDAAATLKVLRQYKGIDPRLKITRSPRNLHIAGATNLAAEFATGHFVAFLDHDDTLAPDALACVAQAISEHPNADVLYTDEDKIEPDGSLSEPYLKPDWSPEHLLSVMYILHLLVVRKSLFLALGGMRSAFTGAQDYDLALRATAQARDVVHVPRVLYHWRKVPGSAAAVVDAKPDALANARAAVRDFVRSKADQAEVEDGLFAGSYRVKWPVDPAVPVTLLMLTGCRSRRVEGRGNILLVKHAIDSIVEKSTFENYRIVLLVNSGLPTHTRRNFEDIGIRIEDYPNEQPFNYSRMLNRGFQMVETEDVIVLNDDIEIISADWIEALLSFSRQPKVGIVGARLLYPDDRIQHAGVVLGVNGASAHIFHGTHVNDVSYCGFSHIIRNYSAVTGAVMATRMSVVREVGSFDEALSTDYNDIDFCLRLRASGYRIVYTPHATLYHFERSSLKRAEPAPADQSLFVSRWSDVVEADPYYHPLLPRDRLDCVTTVW
jgi:O-antigen biosynthesis protein